MCGGAPVLRHNNAGSHAPVLRRNNAGSHAPVLRHNNAGSEGSYFLNFLKK